MPGGQPGLWKGQGDRLGTARTEAVGPPGAHILFLHNKRHTQTGRSNVGGRRHIPAETDKDICPAEDFFGDLRGTLQASGNREKVL